MEKHIPVHDAAKKLNCSDENVRRLLREQQIFGVLVGRTWRVPQGSLVLSQQSVEKQ